MDTPYLKPMRTHILDAEAIDAAVRDAELETLVIAIMARHDRETWRRRHA